MRRIIVGIAVLFLVVGIISAFPNTTATTAQSEYKVSLPFIVAPPRTSPTHTTSFYIQDINAAAMWDLGCELGIRMKYTGESVAFTALHFGQPWQNSNGENGVLRHGLPGEGSEYISYEQVEAAVDSFAVAYTLCGGRLTSPILILGVGLSNFGPWVNAVHGQAWGTVINNIEANIAGTMANNHVLATGAADIEPGFNSPEASQAWVDGFFETHDVLYNFGTADGCPTLTFPHFSCGTAEYPEWTVNDVVIVSGGRIGLRVVPQIYATDGGNAEQWYLMAVYMYENSPMIPFNLRGTLTQFEACEQRPESDGCMANDPFNKNEPSTGWLQLRTLIDGDSRTDQNISWLSDIQWQIR